MVIQKPDEEINFIFKTLYNVVVSITCCRIRINVDCTLFLENYKHLSCEHLAILTITSLNGVREAAIKQSLENI